MGATEMCGFCVFKQLLEDLCAPFWVEVEAGAEVEEQGARARMVHALGALAVIARGTEGWAVVVIAELFVQKQGLLRAMVASNQVELQHAALKGLTALLSRLKAQGLVGRETAEVRAQ